MSTIIMISGNYTVSLQAKKVRNLLESSKGRINTKYKHFGIYSYFRLLDQFGKLKESRN